jgi:hypothetical protein
MDKRNRNLLLEDVEYKIERTPRGTWKRYLYPDGRGYAEFTSHARFGEWPMLHYTSGISPETGRRKVARGVIAVGRVAVGGVAFGQAAFGILAIGQLGVGLLFGLGQAAAGLYGVGQLALGVEFGLGQVATGATAIGQLAAGDYVLAQLGFGTHVWDQEATDPEARRYFLELWERLRG